MPYADPEAQRAANRRATQRYYEKNREEARAKKARQRERMRAIIREAKDVSCTDCGHRYPHYVMEFDHDEAPAVPGHRPSDLVSSGSPRRLREEIARCEVVCANCHAARTWFRAHPHGDVAQSAEAPI